MHVPDVYMYTHIPRAQVPLGWKLNRNSPSRRVSGDVRDRRGHILREEGAAYFTIKKKKDNFGAAYAF